MEERVRHDTLFLAVTRPAMKWGVPYAGFQINLMGGAVIGMIAGSPLWWLVIWPPVHLAMRAMTARDHNFFNELLCWWQTRAKSIGSASTVENGGSTLEGIPSGCASDWREFPVSV